ncbi:MAG: tetratricopeptide repeat protein [Spirochaetes bacterium]|nr:tetratricopeptide repeat protein [Spirochaetota bacterium]
MSRIKVQQKHIVIERNPVEKALMAVKDFVKQHKVVVRYAALAVFVVIIVVVAVALYLDKIEKGERERYDTLLARYNAGMARGDEESVKSTISQFREFVASAHNDYIEDTGPYILGNMYYSQKMYGDAKRFLLKYVNESPETELTSLALLKAAVASAEMNQLEEAFQMLSRIEKEFKDSLASDQVYYHLAGYYLKKNNRETAKKYYEREITTYPGSPFAAMARKRLLLLTATP